MEKKVWNFQENSLVLQMGIEKRNKDLIKRVQKKQPPVSVEKGIFKNITKFTRKHLTVLESLLEAATLSKRDSNTGVSLWNLQNF